MIFSMLQIKENDQAVSDRPENNLQRIKHEYFLIEIIGSKKDLKTL